eukprot:TRINITY_DN5785_c0_g1_i11.p1 TRINITY_DN5785_c0_g1~~TRINITY_DN5785_c0_g1_i11.p1  ORF type:complete len:383 (+),score=44.74 TRINITY_DN5785_c0_g1_i11:93-1151(+)
MSKKQSSKISMSNDSSDDLYYEPIIPPLEQPKRTFPAFWMVCGSIAAFVNIMGILLLIYVFAVYAVKYEEHGGEEPKPSPIPFDPCQDPSATECDSGALKELKSMLPESVKQSLTSWVGDDPCDGWQGITCRTEDGGDKRVVDLDLGKGNWQKVDGEWRFVPTENGVYEPDLKIAFPEQLSALAYLETLALDKTGLEISYIPPELSSLKNMKDFNMQGNSFTGTLPVELSEWDQLRTFNVQQNQLNGTIPVQYSTWTKLEFLQISRNSFSGSLPVELSNWQSIQVAYLQKNSLSGSIPEEYSVLLDTLEEIEVAPLNTRQLCISSDTLTLFQEALGFAHCDLYNLMECTNNE